MHFRLIRHLLPKSKSITNELSLNHSRKYQQYQMDQCPKYEFLNIRSHFHHQFFA